MRRAVPLLTVLFGSALAAGAADAPRVVFLGVWDRSQPLIDAAARELAIPVAYYRPEEVLAAGSAAQKAAQQCELVYVLNMQPDEAAALTRLLLRRVNPRQKIVPLDARGSQADLDKAGLLTHDEQVPRYWVPNGSINIRRLLVYTSVKYLGGSGQIEPAVLIPDFGYYEPGHDDSFLSLAALRTFKQQHGTWKDGAPVAALLIQQSFWVTHDTKVVDAQIRALEAHGVNGVVIFGDRQAMVENLIRETHPDVLIEDRHGAMWESRQFLEWLDVPYLRPISMLATTVDEWKKDPRGLSPRDVGLFMTVQESWGTLEPVVVGGMQVNISGFQLHEPVADGVERFAARTASWLRLKRKANAQKKVAIIYYNSDLGRDDLMRGSPTGAFMDGPESAVRFLPRMKEAGYRIDRLPKNAAELIGWMQKGGREIGPWNQGELEQEVNEGNPALIPAAKYLEWFHSNLSAANQQKVIKAFGPPPGKLMVVERKGEKYIVIPRIELGNVILAPQPERGAKQDEKLLHSRDEPPPHSYLAFYWWLAEEYRADALVHWGTHGTLEMLPGKEAGMSREDWSDICAGNMPIVDLWIMDNLAEAITARRRTYAELVDHMVPPAVSAGMAGANAELRSDLDKFGALETGLLREEYRKRISATAIREGVAAKLNLRPKELLSDREIQKVAEFVREVNEARTPLTLHVLGQAPEAKYFLAYLVQILGSKFLDHLAAVFTPPAARSESLRREWIENKGREFLEANLSNKDAIASPDLMKDLEFAREMRDRLKLADREIVGLLHALDARYVQPGPGPEPIRNPDSIPGGRNLYALNPEEIPTKPAWEVAVRLVDELVKRRHPQKVGLDLNGMDTMRDFGVMEAQILYLMGVRPVWDRNGLAIDVELIPQSELKRPRIDVFCAMGGQYKENFTTRVKLMDKAVRLVSTLDEKDNLVREDTLRNERSLLSKGLPPEQARDLSAGRIFGTKPGNISGTNILFLVPRSGVWKKDSEVSDTYVDNMSYVYTGDHWGDKIDGVYQQAIQGTDTVVRVWASNMTSQLSNHHAYEYLGGLSMAVEKMTGKQPEAYIADVRDPNGARIREFNEVLGTNLETELLNKEWIQGMKDHGYAGAGHASELAKNAFGWSVTRKGSVTDAQWNDIYATYVEDKYHMQVRAWMEKENPHALEEMTATMLEASRKGYWNADRATVEKLSTVYAQLAVKYGDSGGLVSGGNQGLETYVSDVLESNGTAPGKTLAQQMSASLAKSAGGKAGPAPAAVAVSEAPPIVGVKLARLAQAAMRPVPAPLPPPPAKTLANAIMLLCGVALFAYGFAVRRGAI
jgi:cobaltochelatase CobN